VAIKLIHRNDANDAHSVTLPFTSVAQAASKRRREILLPDAVDPKRSPDPRRDSRHPGRRDRA